MFTASELFDLAAQVEANGERFYRYALTRVERDSFRDIFRWLADQELQHKTAFADIKEKVALGAEDHSFFTQQGGSDRSAMGRHAFSLDELQIESIRDEEEILEAALLFEEDTMLFFEFISPLSSPIREHLPSLKGSEQKSLIISSF